MNGVKLSGLGASGGPQQGLSLGRNRGFAWLMEFNPPRER